MEKTCKYCEEIFEAKRSTADFCSTNCRVKFNNSNPKTYAIYCLINPITGVIFYVGCSCQNLSFRLQCHINEYTPERIHDRPSPKQSVIQEILAAGKKPTIEVLEKVNTADAKDAEQRWIKKLTSEGVVLTNFEVTGKWPYKNSKLKQPEQKPKVRIQNLTEPTHVVKPITTPKKKSNIAINTENNNPSLRSILTGLGYQPTGEKKPYVPKVK
jgi:hypothetical protein